MERRFYQSKSSLYNLLRNSKINDFTNLNSKAITSSIQKSNAEYRNIIQLLSKLQSSVVQKGNNIDDIVKQIELCFENKSNDQSIIISLYTSKVFLDIFNAYNISLSEYQEKILNLIEKILQNKKIGKYLSKNQFILPKLLKYITKPKLLETSIKMSETLLMNGQSLFPMEKMTTEINEIYSYMEMRNKLDTFCRILAILIFDYKKMEYSQMFKSKETLRIKPLTKITVQNQTICLHFRNFFENIVKKLRSRFDKTKKMANDSSIAQNIINYIMTDSNFDISADDGDIFDFSFGSAPKKEKIIKYTFVNLNSKNNILKEVVISKKNFENLIHLNVFSSFLPNFSNIKNPNNIYNTYKHISSYLTKIKPKTKITQQKKYYITVFKYSTYQIEMLFVLSTLLCSKRKVEIQDKVNALKIIPILDDYIEYMEWGNIFSKIRRPYFNDEQINFQDESAYHGEGCCCDSDTALKIQYLRLIYSFCCRDDDNVTNKLELFSEKDITFFMNNGYMNILAMALKEKYNLYKKSIYATMSRNFIDIYEEIISGFDSDCSYESIEKIMINMVDVKNISNKVDEYNESDSNIGLLHKLIYKYMRECYYSSSKFWLSSCIEIMLRGNNTFFQTYIACSGMIPCLLYDILYSQKEQNQIMQLSFDILGELIKFNRGNFYLLSYYFADTKEANEFYKKILMKDSLVDSNVLLRSIILSNYFFDKTDEGNNVKQENFFTKKCKLCSYIQDKVEIIFVMLISIIHPDNVNQTNISCVNSAILILAIEFLKGTLSIFLGNLRKKNSKEITDGIENFKVLIVLWKKFYNFRPKDATSLYHSTTIPFNILQEVATLLLMKDPNSKMSLYYEGKND